MQMTGALIEQDFHNYSGFSGLAGAIFYLGKNAAGSPPKR
jgi:hypothetical protein